MYNYAASMGLLEGMSNVYLLSTATLLLAIIIAFYCANFLKEDNLENEFKHEGTDESGTEDIIEDNKKYEVIADDLRYRLEQENDGNSSDEQNVQLHGDGLVSKLKSARIKELEAQLTKQQLEEERRIEREQLAAIFELLKKQETELNTKELDESELSAQLHLYR